MSGREESRLFTAQGCLAEETQVDLEVSKLGGKVVSLIEAVEIEINYLERDAEVLYEQGGQIYLV